MISLQPLLIITLLGLMSSCLAEQQEEPPTTAEDAAAEVAHPAEPLSAENTQAILAKEGEVITVSGVVEYVGGTSSGNITFINFKGDGDFSCVVFADKRDALEKELGASIQDSLRGKSVTVFGKIETYKEKPQIKITEFSQLGLEGKLPAAAGGGKAPIAKLPIPDEVLRAKDDRDLEEAYQFGGTVGVTGKIRKCYQNDSETITYLEFSSADFKGVIFAADLPKLLNALEHDDVEVLMKALKSREVMLIGKVDKYRDDHQMPIQEATQIVFDPPEEEDEE